MTYHAIYDTLQSTIYAPFCCFLLAHMLTGDDFGIVMSQKCREVFFTSSRAAELGSDNIYRFKITPPALPEEAKDYTVRMEKDKFYTYTRSFSSEQKAESQNRSNHS